MIGDMSTDPQQIRVQIDAILGDLPRVGPDATTAPDLDLDIQAAGSRLEEAHQVLVDALESVEKG